MKKLWDRRPFKRDSVALSSQTSRALRQLHARFQRQKRGWIYVMLSSLTLGCVYGIFSVFVDSLWEGVIPAICIVVTGIGIAMIEVRRCSDIIRMIRQAYNVQVQIDKANEEKEKEEAKKQEAELKSEEKARKQAGAPSETQISVRAANDTSESNGTSGSHSGPPEEGSEA
ncbi:MAG: hypothetical protein O7G87_11480 [bacterium]|nr:hypothetical protein [bacterium]